MVQVPDPWFSALPPRLIEVAQDWRYSDEYLGNLFRSCVGRERSEVNVSGGSSGVVPASGRSEAADSQEPSS